MIHHLHSRSVRMMFFWLWCAGWLVVSALLLLPVPMPAAIGSNLVAHFALFSTMAFATVSFCHDPLRLTGLAILTLAGSAALELAQALVPYRTFDLLDGIANAIGIAIGYLAALVVLYVVIRPTRRRLREAAPGAASPQIGGRSGRPKITRRISGSSSSMP